MGGWLVRPSYLPVRRNWVSAGLNRLLNGVTRLRMPLTIPVRTISMSICISKGTPTGSATGEKLRSPLTDYAFKYQDAKAGPDCVARISLGGADSPATGCGTSLPPVLISVGLCSFVSSIQCYEKLQI